MIPRPEALSWFDPSLIATGTQQTDHPREFERIWRGFMTAQATLGLVLLLVQGSIFFLAPPQSSTPLLICAAYFCAALAVRLMTQPEQLVHTFDAQWLRTVGVDVVTFTSLQILQNSAIDYSPLFALPVLMAGILGSMMLAMGAAASVTLLLFAYASWQYVYVPLDGSSHFLQAALTGIGCFAISFIASQLTARLASVELRAQRSQLAATVQRQVNELVVESLADGILVADERGQVRSANPAALLLLGTHGLPQDIELNLTARPGWQALMEVISASLAGHRPWRADITIGHEGHGSRQLLVSTRLTAPLESDARGLCVVFMQDQREVQARIRAEKLSSMGRMSAAVAHEIRNPLAAITQANALLAEDLTDPGQLQLATMVQQNAQRLEKIVHDILHLAQAPASDGVDSAQLLDLTEATGRNCRDWKAHNAVTEELLVDLPADTHEVWFDQEHLRRILINLLDNAYRYTSHQVACIQVSLDFSRAIAPHHEASLHVWSNGAPLDPSVEQHLFEPFFSSESRSSGLGLYICRELCENHGASMSYDRLARPVNGQCLQGNEFSVIFTTQPMNSPTQPGKLLA